MTKYIITNGYSYICDNLCNTTKEIDKIFYHAKHLYLAIHKYYLIVI